MFPTLVTIYVRLAHREEADVRAEFGRAWDDYAARTPGFFPRLGRLLRISGERSVHA
jgi:methanethiol S-methyltransferase